MRNLLRVLVAYFLPSLIVCTGTFDPSAYPEDYTCYHAYAWSQIRNSSKNDLFKAYTGITSSKYVFPTVTPTFYHPTPASIRRRLHNHGAGGPPPGPPPGPPTSGGGGGPPGPPTSGGGGGGGGGASSSSGSTGSAGSTITTGWQIKYTGIVAYDHNLTQYEYNQLNTRPKKSSDFDNGEPTVSVGDYVVWGQDIGYSSTSCTMGYWPPGPVCPSNYSGEYIYPILPAPENQTTGCYVGGSLGVFVSGVDMWSWSDGDSYNSNGVWHNCAMEFETYDMDICWGHAASGSYHHHSYSPCLQRLLGDEGSAHSPIYGFAFDGYPVFGPYQDANTVAVSCWEARDYSSHSATGCSDGKRSCLLKDQFDYTQGTTTASSAGPDVGSTVTTQSGNDVTAYSGVYFEDYYWNSSCSARGGQYLDEHNGHSHGDYGYHYHLTMNASTLLSTFPYTIGPQYYGCIAGNGFCITDHGDLKASDATLRSQCKNSTASRNYACIHDSFTPTFSTSSQSSTTKSPTKHPTRPPTAVPTKIPTRTPTAVPTKVPTLNPTYHPTAIPTTSTPTEIPTAHPTRDPSFHPSAAPSHNDTSSSQSSASSGLGTSGAIGIAVGVGGGILVLCLLVYIYYSCCTSQPEAAYSGVVPPSQETQVGDIMMQKL